jgi:hypothetical protein
LGAQGRLSSSKQPLRRHAKLSWTQRNTLSSPATTSAGQGTEFEAWDGYITGKNLRLVRGKPIVQEWKTTEEPEGHPFSRLEITLVAKEGQS